MSIQPEYESGVEEEAGGQIEPLHVVIDSPREVESTPEFGAWRTYSWGAAATVDSTMQSILPQTRKRHKAQIIVYIQTGFVQVGSRSQIQNGVGAQLQAGRYPVENSQELFIASDGTNAATVTILDERYL